MKQHSTKNTQIIRDGNGVTCIARTHNWASDCYESWGSSPQRAIKEVITNVTIDGGDTWLLPKLNTLLKKYD